jgi:hypothetical protein
VDPNEWTPRELRRSFVSLLLDNGIPLGEISRRVGHSSMAVTFKRPALGTIWGPHATHTTGQSACDRTSRYTHSARLSCEYAYPAVLGVKGSRVQIPPSRPFFERLVG